MWRVAKNPSETAAPASANADRHDDGAGAAKPSQAAPVSDKSIAVLPFENLSDDKANAYFADGMQDEILTRLAGIADLKVISRTSTQRYKSKPDNLKNVAGELGVAIILEGSVQKSGDRRACQRAVDRRAQGCSSVGADLRS